MDRKTFIKNCGLSCLGGLSVASLMQACGTSSYYAQHVQGESQFTIKKTEFTMLKKGKTIQRKYVLLRSPRFNFPICIYKIDENNYTALLMECTHKSCELQPNGEYLVCPCHGSEFSNKGLVQNPPAEENLKTFQTKTDNENIYVIL